MPITTITKIKIRRGTDAQRKTVVFDVGELAFVTDTDSMRLFVGDGITYGGNSVGMKFYSGDRITQPTRFDSAQVGDLIYDTGRKGLFILSGVNVQGFPDYANVNAYQNISTQVDNNTIQYNANRQLSVINDSISAIHISSQAFDLNNGFLREVPNGVFKINIDNNSIRFDTNRKMYADPRYINWSLLPTTYPGAGTNKLWIDVVNGNLLKVAL
jgi:hypothetical protein